MAASSDVELRHILQRIARAFEERTRRGLLPFEGEWLPAHELAARQDQGERRARLQYWEVVGVLAAIAVLGLTMIALLWLLLY
jgi:hypothetical protein